MYECSLHFKVSWPPKPLYFVTYRLGYYKDLSNFVFLRELSCQILDNLSIKKVNDVKGL